MYRVRVDIQLGFINLVKARTILIPATPLINIPIDPAILLQSSLLKGLFALRSLHQTETLVVLATKSAPIFRCFNLYWVGTKHMALENVLLRVLRH